MTHFSLFTGIGGIDLAAEWAGFETVGQCEFADFPTKVLEKHWPDVPRWRDIRNVTKEKFMERTGLQTVDLISGGFPCQPFSVAGKRQGQDDDRYLWPEMLRVINELRPRWVLGENVVGLLRLGIERVLSELESVGYRPTVFQIPACGVGAPHKRERIFISAYSISERWDSLDKKCKRRCGNINLQNVYAPSFDESYLSLDFYGIISNPGSGAKRNDDGLSEGVDRLKSLGNAVVPQQVYPILKAIAEILGQ